MDEDCGLGADAGEPGGRREAQRQQQGRRETVEQGFEDREGHDTHL